MRRGKASRLFDEQADKEAGWFFRSKNLLIDRGKQTDFDSFLRFLRSPDLFCIYSEDLQLIYRRLQAINFDT